MTRQTRPYPSAGTYPALATTRPLLPFAATDEGDLILRKPPE